jgi:hypothetical protein
VLAAAGDGAAALSTHGEIVEGLVTTYAERGVPIEDADGVRGFPKGAAWRLDVLDGQVRKVTVIPPPRGPRG